MKIWLITIAGLVLCFGSVFGQQLPQTVYASFYPYAINDAELGVYQEKTFMLSTTRQWANIQDSPQTYNLFAEIPLRYPMTVGGQIQHQTFGITRITQLRLSGNYELVFDNQGKNYLRFGMSLRPNYYNLDFSSLDDPNDPTFAVLAPNKFYMDGSFGVSYHANQLFFGAAVNTLRTTPFQDIELVNSVLNPLANVMVNTGVNLDINPFFKLTGNLLYQYRNDLASVWEISAVADYDNQIQFGAGYLDQSGIFGMFGLQFFDVFNFFYCYSSSGASAIDGLGASHQFMLKLALRNR